MTALEIAVQDAAGARTALAGGADRVELCAALGATGGLTPSIGLVRAAVATGIGVHALVRCRPGGCVYTCDEVDVMADDIVDAVVAGVRGVVIGALGPTGEIDRDATAFLIDAARTTARLSHAEVDVTFHRAFDVIADPLAGLQVLADLGVDRVLTSGGAATADAGIETIAALAAAGTGVQIMAGGGV